MEVTTATEVPVLGKLDMVAFQPGCSKSAAFIPYFTDCDALQSMSASTCFYSDFCILH